MAKAGVICDKKVPTNCGTRPMSARDENRLAATEMRMVQRAMGLSLMIHHRIEEILEEALLYSPGRIRVLSGGHSHRQGNPRLPTGQQSTLHDIFTYKM